MVMANPPFVRLEKQAVEIRERALEMMGAAGSGRIDTYLAFLYLATKLLRPGGYGLFVLPHSFLLGKSAGKIREYISESCWIRVLVDLSGVKVFDNVGAYVVLLILQKKDSTNLEPPAVMAQCQDLVGQALEDVLSERVTEQPYYSVYLSSQTEFEETDWQFTPPSDRELSAKINRFPKLSEFLEVKQGFVSGKDEVFILDATEVPKGEEGIFMHFLPDRKMGHYRVPNRTTQRFFYPYVNGKPVDESTLKKRFPKTWRYLVGKKKTLLDRGQVEKGNIPWWRPERPRRPQDLLCPKIVTPHLALVPRFGLDSTGKYAVSRSPYLIVDGSGSPDDMLKFFIAVLNSTPSFWQITRGSHKYAKGYAMLEVQTLKNVRVPNPEKVLPNQLKKIIELVEARLKVPDGSAHSYNAAIDSLICDLYGLSASDREYLSG